MESSFKCIYYNRRGSLPSLQGVNQFDLSSNFNNTGLFDEEVGYLDFFHTEGDG